MAEYSLSLVEQLRRLAQVEVFVADDRAGRTVLSFDDVPVRPASDFWTQHARKAFDAAIFHLGNQAGHAYMADALVRTPCKRVAVLHDGSLYHLYEGVSRWRLLREISAEEGWAAAWRAWRRMLLPGSDSYNHPLLRRICCASDLLIAHSAFLAERLRAVTKNRVELVPYGATPFIDDGGQLQAHARRALSLPTDAVLFGVFGYVTAAKRVEQVIEAFTMSSLQQSWLYIAGEVGLLTPLAVRRWADDPARCARHRIRFEPAYRTPLYVLLAMQAVDVGIVLRFPTTGETSAVLSDLLSMGKPVIVSDVGAFREVPDECAIKVLVSKDEVADLVTAMRRLAFEPGLRAHMASAARMYSAQQTWSTVARIYHRIVAQVCAQ